MEDIRKEEVITRLPLIGDDAPEFTAVTTKGTIEFPKDYKGKWVILFSHPADFTPVCTTEFMTFASMQDEFKELNTELVGLSIDSVHSHIAWLENIKNKIEFNGMKNVEIKFPVIADISMEVANKYGMVQPNVSATSAVRAVFFIDPKGKIRTIMYYPAALGRNFKEIKRVILGLQKSDSAGVALPANWEPGKDMIIPPPGTSEEAFNRCDKLPEGAAYCAEWYLCFKHDK